MRRFTLEDIYTDPGASTIRGFESEHRKRVAGVLAAEEAIYLYWWDRDISGLVLFTDRRIVQIPRFRTPSGLFSSTFTFDTWQYPYESITAIECFGGSLLEMPRLILQRHDEAEALIVFSKVKRETLEEMAETLRRLHARWLEQGRQEQPELATLTDHANRLRELYDLYQDGILDEDAYRRAKARLIAE